jgi:hypothetical protein
MNAWSVIEWAVFVLGLIWVVMTNAALWQHYKSSSEPQLPANATGLTQLVSVLVIAGFGYSPFHLIWLLPVSYLTGFVALRSRAIGRLAWLYGYVIAYTVPSNW